MRTLQRTIGNQAMLRLSSHALALQPKLTINQPGDQYEQEADRVAEQVMRMPEPVESAALTQTSHAHATLQRKCQECEEEEKLQRKEIGSGPEFAPPIVHEVLNSPGQPLDQAARDFFEPRLGSNLSAVRVHDDSRSAESAASVGAVAYTVGNQIVFADAQYAPNTVRGRRLLAHELAHTVQQRYSRDHSSPGLSIGDPQPYAERQAEHLADAVTGTDAAAPSINASGPIQLARLCTPAATCSPTGVAGSAVEADTSATRLEVSPRARRKRMTPARAVATGHAGRARALEKFLEAQAPGHLANIQGIFIDWDLSGGAFDALTEGCADWISIALPAGSPTPPGMAGATKPCTFVHGALNHQAFVFNTSAASIIGGLPRENWRIETLQTLIHETEHPHFDTSAHPTPAGVNTPTCTHADIDGELSELAAILSEFPTIFQAAAAEASATGPVHRKMAEWFKDSIRDGGENIKSVLEQIGCRCECAEVDAFVIDTFNFESGSWTTPEKDAFHRELRRPVWGVRWPLAPSVP